MKAYYVAVLLVVLFIMSNTTSYAQKPKLRLISTDTVEVNYDLTVEQEVAKYKFEWVDRDINSKYFSTKMRGKHIIQVEVYESVGELTQEDLISELDSINRRPADLYVLIELGERNPELHMGQNIYGFGSKSSNKYTASNDVPYIGHIRWSRGLGLGVEMEHARRFAAVKK